MSCSRSPYVNEGDPRWYQELRANRKNVDCVAGPEEFLADLVGNAYACDGDFFVTLDMPAPIRYSLATIPEPGRLSLLLPVFGIRASRRRRQAAENGRQL